MPQDLSSDEDWVAYSEWEDRHQAWQNIESVVDSSQLQDFLRMVYDQGK